MSPPVDEAPTGRGRWVELVPVEVFALWCDDHPEPKPVSWGLSDAVEAWSDCNRADGRIYRVEDNPDAHRYRLPGETARVWVPDEVWPFFEKRWGEGYRTGEDVIDMVAPTATRH
jgi:hypothetical protein